MSNHKIDWISISIPLPSFIQTNTQTLKPEIPSHYRDQYPIISDFLSSFPDWQLGKGNRIFNRSISSKIGGFHIFWRDTLNFSLIEIEGLGVCNLRTQKFLKPILRQYSHLLTRLDIATDWETNVTPYGFASIRESGRFKSHSHIISDTGETYYVGSRTSDRFCRIYRYSEPHPRTKLLRCEYQLKDENAKIFAEALQHNTLSTLVGMLHRTFGFCHPLINDHKSTQKMLAAPRASRMGATERWLFAQVIPACAKLIDDGQKDIVDIFGKKLYALFISRDIADDNSLQLNSGE